MPHKQIAFLWHTGSTLACIKSWLSLACSTSSWGSTKVPEALLYFSLLSVLFFPLRSYDKCCTSVPVRFFSCLYYNRNERYALVGKRVTYHWDSCLCSVFVTEWLPVAMLGRSMSVKLRKATLNSLNVCGFSLWVMSFQYLSVPSLLGGYLSWWFHWHF